MTETYEADVEGLGTIHNVNKPFDDALKTIKGAGANVISARDLAYSRIQKGRKSSLCNKGSYVKEGSLYVPDKTLFIGNSPLLNQRTARKAVQAHRQGKEFYVDDGFAKKYLEQAEADKNKAPEKRRVLIVNKRSQFSIPTNRFKDEELTLWSFKDQAEKYGDFLRENKIDEMPVYLTKNIDKNFLNQMWFSALGYRSELDGNWNLSYDYRARGVLKETSEAGSRLRKSKKAQMQVKLPYTPNQLDKIIRTTENVKKGKAGNASLENTIKFLEKLKQ